jgi:outer membrane protein assembly factor BamB
MKNNYTMKRIISNFLLLVSLIVISYVFYRCTTPDTGSKSVQINNDQLISEWREENRTGVSAETGLLESWPESGPEMIWSNTELPKGYSSVSFGNNTIYVTGNNRQNDILVALDKYGKIKWKTSYGRSWTASNPESRCTPTVEGNRVYVSSGFGDLACIDGTSGEIVWTVKASEIYKGTYGEWGIAESLIIDGDKVYFTTGGPETTTIALNKNTGDLIWKSASINDAPAYVSPILIDYANKKLIVNVSLHYVFAVDESDGVILWKIKHTEALDTKKSTSIWPDAPLIKCVTPLYHDGKIYVTGGYDHGGIMLSLADSGKNILVAWTDTVLDVHHGGVVLVDGYIYGANWLNNSNGNWCCIDWNTGKKMWEEHWKCKGSIISAEGLLYIYDEKSGYVGLVRSNPEKFDLISSFKVSLGSGPHWAHPVINNGNLYIRHGNALMVFNIKK